jgi:hypothetical protein
VDLAGERDRRQRCDRERQPPAARAQTALEGEERQRQEHRDRSEQVAGRLRYSVGREREGEPSGERGDTRQPELSEPGAREAAGAHEGEQHEDVPGEHEPERPPQGPEHGAEGPARRIERPVGLRTERERIPPGITAVLEVVADEPEVVRGLEMVARRGLAVARRLPGQEVRARVPNRRRGRDQPRG